MKGTASVGRAATRDLWSFVKILKLTAESEADAEMLAIIYRTLFGLNGPADKRVVIVDPKQPGMIGEWSPSRKSTAKENG